MRQFVLRPSLSLALLGSIVLLSSCATLSKQECIVGDWQAIGYNDGVAGYQSDRLASHAKACAKASVAPNYLAWERGRSWGLSNTARPVMLTMSVGADVSSIMSAP
nr:DUF2799 domain-containing protein [Psychrobacter sp. JCM 18903]